jgi:hypothetical protein
LGALRAAYERKASASSGKYSQLIHIDPVNKNKRPPEAPGKHFQGYKFFSKGLLKYFPIAFR